MKKKLIALLLGTTLALAGCGGDDEKATEKETASTGAGQEAKLYEQKCSSCHGQNLEGGVGPKLEATGLSKEDIEKVIAEGKGAMPAGLLQGDEASAVADWLSKK